MNRGKILDAWRKKVAGGTRLVGGVDFDPVLKATGVAGLLPIGDANAISLVATKSRVVGGKDVPVLAPVCATDPLRMMENFLQEIKAIGAAGVQNSPSVGLIDGNFRKTIEDSRLGYDREVEMIGIASKLDLLTAAFAFSPEDARKMADIGADVVVAHAGFSDRNQHPKLIAEIAVAARSARKNILVIGFSLVNAGLDGIYGEE